jgi:hypothetical protein
LHHDIWRAADSGRGDAARKTLSGAGAADDDRAAADVGPVSPCAASADALRRKRTPPIRETLTPADAVHPMRRRRRARSDAIGTAAITQRDDA